MKGLRHSHHWLQVSQSMKGDLLVWQTFLASFNGISISRQDLRLKDELQLNSDVAGSLGFGVHFWGHWSFGEWPQGWVDDGWTKDLTFLKMSLVCVAIWIWGNEISDWIVHFWGVFGSFSGQFPHFQITSGNELG